MSMIKGNKCQVLKVVLHGAFLTFWYSLNIQVLSQASLGVIG